MGFDGQPSRGCATCRKRRIRCDRQHPICGQCAKSKRACSGPRDPTDVLFVNLNESTKARAEANYRAPISEDMPSWSSEGGIVPYHPAPQTLLETPEQQALGFFMNDFVFLARQHDTSRSFLEHITQVYTAAATSSPIVDATYATALVIYGHHIKAPKLLSDSQRHYGKAVSKLQEAIADTKQAKSNETLMSVLLLGLFDAMTASEQTMFDWCHHADGAAALVKHRGSKDMLSNSVSKKMYWAVRNQSIYNCCIKYEALEPFLDWEALWTTPVELPPDTDAIKLIALCERIPALRSACKWLEAPMSGVVALKCVDLLGNCKIMDGLLQAWAFEMPLWSRPRPAGMVEGTSSDPNTLLYPGRLETYPTLFHSSLWNMWRTYRIVCQMMIVNCYERLYAPSQLTNILDYIAATSIIQEMADGVCAGVPYHLGYWNPVEADTSSMRIPGQSRHEDYIHSAEPEPEVKPKAASALYLVLTCFFACSAITIPLKQRAWLRARLTYIAENTGCAEADVLAKISVLEERRFSITDFAPPEFKEYRDEAAVLLASPDLQRQKASLDAEAATNESRKLRAWRQDFLQQLFQS